MAWRDSRGSRRKMAIFVSSMVLGVAALVSINSFGDSLRSAVDSQAGELLGADLSFESTRPFTDRIEAVVDSIGGQQSRRTSFASMAYFPRTDDARLATVRANEGGYPYYGAIETDPASASELYLEGRNALVDGTLMEQFNVAIGDSVQIGDRMYRVAGRLLQTPRETAAVMLFSPRIYIPSRYLDRSLLQKGSRAEYEVYFQFDDGRDVETLVDDLKPVLVAEQVTTDTIQEQKDGWDQSLSNLYRFLSLVGFMALLLGSLGVASAVNVYVRQRVQTVAVLRCFGARSWPTFGVYLVQSIGMGAVGVTFGVLLGFAIQAVLPGLLGDFLPVDVDFGVSAGSVVMGAGIGLAVTVLFTLLPLLTVKDVSPLLALRSDVDSGEPKRRSILWWSIVTATSVVVSLFAVVQAPSVWIGIGYSLVLLAVFGLLGGVASMLIRILRKHYPRSLPYVWRQGIANLYRPRNQTSMMLVSLGLGSFLIGTLLFTQGTLLSQVSVASGEDQPNLVFFDIQPDQLADVEHRIVARGLDVIDRVPIVTMRLHSIKGERISDLRADSTRRTTWAHRREYRSTYREHLGKTEELLDGEFDGSVVGKDLDIVPVTIEKDIAETLGVSVGDSITFDVQGILVHTRISGIRGVEWRRMRTNFFFVFPAGVLEQAPQFNVILARAQSDEVSGSIQSDIVRSYPNISSIDLSLVLGVFEAIFSRISLIVRFMSLFSIITGLLVLAGAVILSRFQRIEETVLLKTIGASRRQIFQIMSIEYLVLGFMAATTGLILATGAGWGLARWVFYSPFIFPWKQAGLIIAIEIVLTVTIGLWNSRGIYQRPPLEVLRSDN